MKLTIPAWLRIAIYVATLILAPVVVYLRAKDYIGDLELALWGAEVTAMGTLAAVNVNEPPSVEVTGPAQVTPLENADADDLAGVELGEHE